MTAERPVSSSDYEWHVAPDGGATFATPDGGWIYVSNSEFPIAGGVGALRFDADGTLVDAYPLLRETNVNCAGGATPWGTWLSCEEVAEGRVFECDPLGEHDAIEHAALGLFKHEAVAVDATQNHLYLTEDESNGGFYRFVPDRIASDGYADLSAGKLQIAELATDGAVTWHDVPDRLLTEGIPTREQVAASTPFKGGEGIWYFDDTIFFSTKGDNRVWAYSVTQQRLDVLYDAAAAQDPVLTGVDNLTGTCCGDILVAEDGGDMQIVAIRPDGSLKVLAQVVGHDESEITGPAFDPSGTRLYFSSQRGVGSGGITYEVTGPFHLKA
jgi:secreted PhoX family phosphatase